MKISRIFFIALACIVTLFSSAQNNTFFRKYNLSGMQGGLAIAAMPDGGFVGTGQHQDNGSAGSCDIYVYRVDVCGNLLWMKLIGGTAADGGQGVFVAPSGNIVVLGRLENKATMIEMSPSGVVLSTKLFNINGRLMGGTELNNGDYILCGPASGTLNVMRFSPSTGNIIWSKKTLGSGANKVVQDSSNHVFLGSASGSGGAITLHKINQNGSLVWAKKYGAAVSHSDHSAWGCHIIYDHSDSTIVATATINDPSQKILLTKIKASDGSVVWSKSIGSSGADQSRMIVNTGDGYAVVGHSSSFPSSSSNLGITLDASFGNKDVILFKTDYSGALQWVRQYGAADRDKGIGLQYDSVSKGFLISAYSNSSYFDAINFDPVFIRVDSLGMIACQATSPTLPISNYTLSVSTATLDTTSITVANHTTVISDYIPIDEFVCLSCQTTPLFTVSDTLVCPNDSVYFINTSPQGLTCFQEWDISGDKFPGYRDTVIYSWDMPGSYLIQLYSSCGNSADTFDFNITVAAPPSVVTDTLLEACEGDSIQLLALGITGPSDYYWSNGVDNGDKYIPAVSGDSLWVYGVDENGCKDTTFTKVFFTEIEAEALSLPICEDDTALFEITSRITYGVYDNMSLYAPDSVVLSHPDSTAEVLFDIPGFYTIPITITTQNGCSLEITDTITIYPKPIMRASIVDSLASEFSAYIYTLNHSDSIHTFRWDFGDGSNTVATYNPEIHQYPLREPSKYTITIEAESPKGCLQYDSLYVRIKEELVYHIPNTFTPNDDGKNEIFTPIFYSGFDSTFLDFKIYDRWGAEVFSTQTFNVGWDGTINGEGAKTDVYIFVIQFRSKENPEIIIERGRLNLLR